MIYLRNLSTAILVVDKGYNEFEILKSSFPLVKELQNNENV
jgi:hypothetical protein